jgi:ATP-dependent Clp protease ATP-binding subunit ClpC
LYGKFVDKVFFNIFVCQVIKESKMKIRISEEFNKIISYSREEAMRTGSYSIGSDHLFLGIIRHENNNACKALVSFGVDLDGLKNFIDANVFKNSSIPYEHFDKIALSRQAQAVLSIAVIEASKFGSAEVSAEHLLLALFRGNDCYGMAFLRKYNIGTNDLLSYFADAGLFNNSQKGNDEVAGEDNVIEPGQSNDNEGNDSAKSDSDDNSFGQLGKQIRDKFQEMLQSEAGNDKETNLEEFGIDLTKAAREGKLDPVVGREEEISRVIQILGRRKKNNPMLIGEPGVGKSAIVEGLANMIANGNVSPELAKKKLISFDIASVVAGTKYRGDFEKRIKDIIKILSNNPDIILFIDEFHTIVGAGSAQGSLDAANMLKPALARGEIQCIGATTMDEFSKIVEKDGALDRRFQKIIVSAPDVKKSIEILNRLKPIYEKHHGLKYTDEAIEACVKLTDRYNTHLTLPDKAIDVMDEAGSMVKIKYASSHKKEPIVTEEDIATIVSESTGIPVNKVAESEGNRLLKMKERLKARVIGQDDAIEKVVSAILRNRAGLKDPNRPIGTFLFFGPTGVGKTQLAKCLAEYLFDSEDNMVRMDMSEYMEKFSVSKLIGAPPGYVGYENGGQLSEQVRRKPYCVILLDEIEKAHPDVFNVLLQVLDDGRLTDGNGRTVDFKNTIVIMTSNVGTRDVEEYGNGVGFATAGKNLSNNKKAMMEKAIRKTFPPEFINRIDEQIAFNSLSKDNIEQIIDIDIKDLKTRVKETGYKLNITKAAKQFVAEAGFDANYGARPLKRAISRYIEDPVSEFIINDRMLHGKEKDVAARALKLGLSLDKNNTEVTLG